ncbi:protein of unknown function [Cnuella takakiae]|uniref:Shedu protein SduA C-terminal domain-containing protein n=1 Tax=Cnuella takakiae TaxID=1302690 RepID=A0A1M4S865_9BACT|nr:Shedu anti-phage system protein SduA domain-containing protein [Cnuella takakiae]OLY94412.1 hypothetical protein BUE76_22915 [Cnuella takakiae]SHE28404.1 protein of unknown function [Cnuella takakiae]
MSVQYQREIFKNEKLRLFINFGGIDSNDSTSRERLTLNLYALNNKFNHLFSATLQYSEIKLIYDSLNSISILKDETLDNECSFISASEDIREIASKIDNVDVSLLKSVFNKIGENDKLTTVLNALSESEIQNLHAAIRQTNHRKALDDLLLLLQLEAGGNITEEIKEHPSLTRYLAKQPEKIFQNWIEQNLWTLGVDYVKKHPARQIGISSESDLIMETTDGFIDLIELKRPKFDLFGYDDSHKSYYPSKELSKVIGQCMQYLKVLEDYKLILEKTHRFKLLRPRIRVVLGRSSDFKEGQLEALRMLNSTLNQIEIITFDYLHQCGANIVSYYDEQLQGSQEGEESLEMPTIS